MIPRALALLTGGLDSMLAAAMVQAGGVDLQAIHFRTPFTTLTELAEQAAAQLKLPLTLLEADDRYLQLLTQPRFGRCEQAAPCLDCREHLFHRAAELQPHFEAQFLVTGEVLGQRRWGQRRRDFNAFEGRCGLNGGIERPLSGKLLDPTHAQRQGWVDREQLHAIQGKGRRAQLELATAFGFRHVPAPLVRCCSLAEPRIGQRVLHAIGSGSPLTFLDCALMAVGEHIELGPATRLVLSRNAAEGDRLSDIVQRHVSDSLALLLPANFRGPVGVVQGCVERSMLQRAARELSQRGKFEAGQPAELEIKCGGESWQLAVE